MNPEIDTIGRALAQMNLTLRDIRDTLESIDAKMPSEPPIRYRAPRPDGHQKAEV
jgi:hypothetical protein